MKRFISLIFAIITLCGCASSDVTKSLFEPGVSQELAHWRGSNYKNITYRLSFDIPEKKSIPVDGYAEIGVTTTEPIPIVLDFKGRKQMIESVYVNGERRSFTYKNEHIIIKDVAAGAHIVSIDFIAPDISLNRRDDFLYTLLVPDRARTLFPCFDQPDMKGLYTLTLNIPDNWEGVANGKILTEEINGKRKKICFEQTEPLSTYLFSFVAGEFERETYNRDDRTISIYHRETDPQKVAQCPVIAQEVFDALTWMENYTSVPYPFAKYDLIILPGFQYGGMEHTGATLYNDRRLFLSEQPTINEKLGRSSLIAHETAHMWFGDYVTMEWFDEVWTKEVFANYFASKIVEPLFPQINHRLNFITDYLPSAYSEERTDGTNPIKQHLDNLRNAGLVYGNIIYNKSPIVMEMLVKIIGEDNFQNGIRNYLKNHPYGNATWGDLIESMKKFTSINLKSWSDSWVQKEGMPHISASIQGYDLVVKQRDPLGRGVTWPQTICYEIDGRVVKVNFNVGDTIATTTIPDEIEGKYALVVPNIDGSGYGFFKLPPENLGQYWEALQTMDSPSDNGDVYKGSLLITLYENLRQGNIPPEMFLTRGLQYIATEDNPLLFSLGLGYITDCHRLYLRGDEPACREIEDALWVISTTHPDHTFRLQAFRGYRSSATSEDAVERLYKIWKKEESLEGIRLSESDYISLSYTLAILLPDRADAIVSEQLSRITNPDRVEEYRFISPSVSPDRRVRDDMFESLLEVENRAVEPWASAALSYLNHPLRQGEAVEYILPALEEMEEIQSTGDIFFPSAWARALLSGHTSKEALLEVESFFEENPDYPLMLGNKIRQQSWHLRRL